MKYEPPTLTYLGKIDPSDPGRVLILDVTVFGGWRVRFWRRIDAQAKRFDAALSNPGGREPFTLHESPTIEKAVESLGTFLAHEVGLDPHYVVRALQSAFDQWPPP